MIALLRKIRQNLLKENGVSKYLIYALGEIVLVVIGILIALQINGWNQNRSNAILENEYYCRLLDDVKQDREQLDNLLKAADIRLKAANQAARLLQQQHAIKLEVGTEINKTILAIYYDFTPNNSAFEDLKSGANLNIIRDKGVIKALNNYFNKIEGYVSIAKVNSEHAVAIHFAPADKFATGWVHATLKSERFKFGMEQDVYDAIKADSTDALDKDTQYKLYNTTLELISINYRLKELYGYMNNEIGVLTAILEAKCFPGSIVQDVSDSKL